MFFYKYIFNILRSNDDFCLFWGKTKDTIGSCRLPVHRLGAHRKFFNDPFFKKKITIIIFNESCWSLNGQQNPCSLAKIKLTQFIHQLNAHEKRGSLHYLPILYMFWYKLCNLVEIKLTQFIH